MGYDANALYLNCIAQEMPVGPFIRRHADNDFKAEKSEKYAIAFHWLDYLIQKNKIKIDHYINSGKETRILGYPVDGFQASETCKGVIYQFHGELYTSFFFFLHTISFQDAIGTGTSVCGIRWNQT